MENSFCIQISIIIVKKQTKLCMQKMDGLLEANRMP